MTIIHNKKVFVCFGLVASLLTMLGDSSYAASPYDIDYHHVFPQKFRSNFLRAGINIDNYTIKVPAQLHRQWSYAYNMEWRQFLTNNPNPSRRAIWMQSKRMARKYPGIRPDAEFFHYKTRESTHHTLNRPPKELARPDKIYYRKIAIRWTYVALLDFTVSAYIEHRRGTLDTTSTIRIATGVGGAWSIATFTEIMLSRYYPAAKGGPKVWAGIAAYIAARQIISMCWDEYQRRQLERQERASQRAEGLARYQRYRSTISDSNDRLDSFLEEITGGTFLSAPRE